MTSALSDVLPLSLVVFLAAGLALVIGLCLALAGLGRAARDCPVSGPAARSATLGVVGAFASIGLGVVASIGALFLEVDLKPAAATLGQFGVTAVSLGVGFAIAASALRESLSRVTRERLAAVEIARREAEIAAPAAG